MALAGCMDGAGDAADPATADSLTPSSSSAPPDVTGQADPGLDGDRAIPSEATPGEPTGPLEEILGLGSAATIQEFVADLRRTEELIAQCMHEQGFDDWIAVPTPSDVRVIEAPQPGTQDFAERYGYGFLTSPPSGVSWTTSGPTWHDDVAVMSDGERAAFYDALHGPVTETDQYGEGRSDGGCFEWAMGVAPGDPYLEGVLANALAFLSGIRERSELDELNAEWAACMRGHGFPESAPWLTQESFGARAQEARAVQPDPDVPIEQTPEGQALLEEEIATALADLDCQVEVGYLERYDEIDLRLQGEYVAVNRADLDELAAASGR